MDALSPEERTRYAELIPLLTDSVQQVSELADGFRFRLRDDAGVFRQTAEWVTLERRCCPFLRFRLGWEPDGGLFLELKGQSGIKEFLRAEIPALAG